MDMPILETFYLDPRLQGLPVASGVVAVFQTEPSRVPQTRLSGEHCSQSRSGQSGQLTTTEECKCKPHCFSGHTRCIFKKHVYTTDSGSLVIWLNRIVQTVAKQGPGGISDASLMSFLLLVHIEIVRDSPLKTVYANRTGENI